MKYKDFPKHDLRRCLSVVTSIEKLGSKATAHYLALALECTRAEVIRAISLARSQLMIDIVKIGAVYRIDGWGLINRVALAGSRQFETTGIVPEQTLAARDEEARLLRSLIDAARSNRPPACHREADLFRFSAQLIKTRYSNESEALHRAAMDYFAQHDIVPRSFPQVVADGLVVDVARLRHGMENQLAGIRTW